MFKKLFGALGVVALACTAAFGSVTIDSTNFPDASTSAGSPNFDYTSFKAAYGLNCDVDDSYFLVLYIQDHGRGGMMTPYVRDVLDTSSGSYVLKPYLHNGQSFRTRYEPAIEVHVEP